MCSYTWPLSVQRPARLMELAKMRIVGPLAAVRHLASLYSYNHCRACDRAAQRRGREVTDAHASPLHGHAHCPFPLPPHGPWARETLVLKSCLVT
jgi:hypothetical protein